MTKNQSSKEPDIEIKLQFMIVERTRGTGFI